LQIRSTYRSYRSNNTVREGEFTQMGPILTEFILRKLKGCTGLRNSVPLLMVDYTSSIGWV
jgi:hypothetical protein